ncbi:MarR family winged helix-turn-helix transcriptional regulator [Cytobacillus sp. Hm23]
MYDPFQQPQVSVELFLTLYKSSVTSVRKLEEKLEPLGLTLGRLCLLYALQRIGKPALPSELGDDLAVTRANISGLLRGLEKSELIRRELDTSDRRRILVHLTLKGKETLEKAWPIYEETVANLLHPLGLEEQTMLLTMLQKLETNSSD